MMNMNRRTLLGGAAAVIALGGAGWAWQAGYLRKSDANSTAFEGAAEAQGSADLSKLGEAPALGERALGPADAKVTVVEYASATCPHCADFHKETFPLLKQEYIDTGKIRFIFREFPFDDLALAAFMVARCAPAEQYFPIIDILYEQQANWARSDNPKEALFKVAQLAGFTEASFEECLKNESVAKGIIETRDKADKQFGVNSTPTFFINGKKLSGALPMEDFRKALDEALKG